MSERSTVAVCKDCDWGQWQDGRRNEMLKEEAETHSIMLAHGVDIGVSWWLKTELLERGNGPRSE